MFTCSIPVNCNIPDSYTITFDADPDIDGIGVIASFYVAAWATLLLLTIVYITSPPEEYDNFGFSKLDIRFVRSSQSLIQKVLLRLCRQPYQVKAGPKTAKALQKAILALSDQQLVTSVSMSIVSLARLCEITQYHFNTIINLSLAAALAHSMTLSCVEYYIKQNVFFRTWRAIAMILSGGLLIALWVVTGSNDWLEVYGLPALCGFKNLRQDFSAPATTSLAILYWFLLKTWVYAITVLLPSLAPVEWFLLILSTSWWLARICALLQKACKESACQLRQHHEILQQTRETLNASNSPLLTRVRLLRARIDRGIWSFLCGSLLLLFGIVYAASQVWASFLFGLSWTCYTFTGSVRIIAGYRATAVYNGMEGSENQWTFGQQLPLLMLILPAFAMAEMFFDDPVESVSRSSSTQTQTAARRFQRSTPSGAQAFDTTPSSGVRRATSMHIDDPALEGYILRRRIDTEQRVGMDISDVTLERHSFHSQSPTTLSEEIATIRDPTLVSQEDRSKQSFILRQVEFCESGDIEEKFWALIVFKFVVFGIFCLLSFVMIMYGI